MESDSDLITHISTVTRLRKDTVEDLLKTGWTFKEGLKMSSTWTSPDFVMRPSVTQFKDWAIWHSGDKTVYRRGSYDHLLRIFRNLHKYHSGDYMTPYRFVPYENLSEEDKSGDAK